MDEIVRQIAVLQADMCWVKSILNLLLVGVIGLAFVNIGVTVLTIWQTWRNNRNRRHTCDTRSSPRD
ncbi:MAG: hypothetical protein ACOC58_00045 [Chloroflexota bacterium]